MVVERAAKMKMFSFNVIESILFSFLAPQRRADGGREMQWAKTQIKFENIQNFQLIYYGANQAFAF